MIISLLLATTNTEITLGKSEKINKFIQNYQTGQEIPDVMMKGLGILILKEDRALQMIERSNKKEKIFTKLTGSYYDNLARIATDLGSTYAPSIEQNIRKANKYKNNIEKQYEKLAREYDQLIELFDSIDKCHIFDLCNDIHIIENHSYDCYFGYNILFRVVLTYACGKKAGVPKNLEESSQQLNGLNPEDLRNLVEYIEYLKINKKKNDDEQCAEKTSNEDLFISIEEFEKALSFYPSVIKQLIINFKKENFKEENFNKKFQKILEEAKKERLKNIEDYIGSVSEAFFEFINISGKLWKNQPVEAEQKDECKKLLTKSVMQFITMIDSFDKYKEYKTYRGLFYGPEKKFLGIENILTSK